LVMSATPTILEQIATRQDIQEAEYIDSWVAEIQDAITEVLEEANAEFESAAGYVDHVSFGPQI
jgi:hypothetical protein